MTSGASRTRTKDRRRRVNSSEKNWRRPLVAAAIEVALTDGRHAATLLRVGDSTAFVLRDGVFQERFPDAHKGEHIQESGTFALPGNPGMVEVDTVMLGNDDVLVLCTDGLRTRCTTTR